MKIHVSLRTFLKHFEEGKQIIMNLSLEYEFDIKLVKDGLFLHKVPKFRNYTTFQKAQLLFFFY